MIRTIKGKLLLNCGVVALLVLLLVGSNYLGLLGLQQEQDHGATAMKNAELSMAATRVGYGLYARIADSVINRDMEKSAKEWSEAKTSNLERLEKVAKIVNTPEQKALVGEAQQAASELVTLYEQKLQPLLKATSDMTPEIKALDHELDKRVMLIRGNMIKLNDEMGKQAEQSDKQFDADMQRTIIKGVLIGLLGLAIIFAVSLWIIRSILKPVGSLSEMLQDVAQGEGDLTKRLDDKGGDEIAEACRWFNLFMDKLHKVIFNVSQTTLQVASASNQLQSTAVQIATGAEEVACQAGTVATASEEMAATSSEIAQNSCMVAEGAKHASESASSGVGVVQETVDGMSRIAMRVRTAAQTVESLGARSDQIGAIIGTIEDIADQTNLLALNAAIEAARAGEQGRGFAVVADEVRALAERTTKATREIGEMIKAIQLETKGAVSAMEEGVHEVEQGTTGAAKSGEALQQILDQVQNVTMQVSQIATAAEEQTATTSEITNNIQQITEVVQETAKGAQESASAASQLAQLAEDLQRLVGQFKLAS